MTGQCQDIFTRLFYYVPNTIYILDGFDALNQEHIKGLLTFIRPLFRDPKPPQGSRILLLSKEQIPGYINITTFIPGTCQISTSINIMRVLLTESSGMYDKQVSYFYSVYILTNIGFYGSISSWRFCGIRASQTQKYGRH